MNLNHNVFTFPLHLISDILELKSSVLSCPLFHWINLNRLWEKQETKCLGFLSFTVSSLLYLRYLHVKRFLFLYFRNILNKASCPPLKIHIHLYCSQSIIKWLMCLRSSLRLWLCSQLWLWCSFLRENLLRAINSSNS